MTYYQSIITGIFERMLVLKYTFFCKSPDHLGEINVS